MLSETRLVLLDRLQNRTECPWIGTQRCLATRAGFAMQAPLALVGSILGLLAWWQTNDWPWLVGAVQCAPASDPKPDRFFDRPQNHEGRLEKLDKEI